MALRRKAFLAMLPTVCTKMALLRGSPDLARVEVGIPTRRQ